MDGPPVATTVPLTSSGSGSPSRRTGSSRLVLREFPDGGGSAGGTFYGDYAGLDAANNAIPFWSDTRNRNLFACRDNAGVTFPPSVCGGKPNDTTLNDQDTYTSNLAVPSTG